MLDQIAMMMNSAYGGRPLRGGNLGGMSYGGGGGGGPSRDDEQSGGGGRFNTGGGNFGIGPGYGGGVSDRGFSAQNIPGASMGHRGPDGTGLAGMRGAPQRQGRQTAEYYPMGMIPTASNMEHVSQFGKTYNYSDTPSMADMARAPWRPETWDPNSDYINQTGGASPNAKWGQMRGGGGRDARSRYLIDRARGRG